MNSEHRKHKLADVLRKRHDTGVDSGPHVVVNAGPGTGKTTTLIEGIKQVLDIPTAIIPSPQQQLIWETINLSRGRAQTICFAAFGRTIVKELEERIPAGCEAKGIHSLGAAAVTRAYGKLRLDDHATEIKLARMAGMSYDQMKAATPITMYLISRLADLAKQTLVNVEMTGALEILAEHYELDINDSMKNQVFNETKALLEYSKDPGNIRRIGIDYTDMIWLPTVNNLPLPKYDLFLVDEAQDLNRAEQQICLACARRMILVGDCHQAIYGFAGADPESMNRMSALLGLAERGCVQMPLTETRRCGKLIVKEARKIFPELTAHESNPAGQIHREKMGTYAQKLRDGDLVVCRVNAPLIGECLKLIEKSIKANVLGRDILKGLKKLLWDMNCVTIAEYHDRLKKWYEKTVMLENRKQRPNLRRLASTKDKYYCMLSLARGCHSLREVQDRMSAIFNDDTKEGIHFGTIHQAKGLEADRVFFLMPTGAECPHPMAKSTWEKKQEENMLLIGITRARSELTYVT